MLDSSAVLEYLERRGPGSSRLQEIVAGFEEKSNVTPLLELFVLDSLDSRRLKEALSTQHHLKGLPKQIPLELLRLITRLIQDSNVSQFRGRKTAEASVALVSQTLQATADLLSSGEEAEQWRAWPALSRLSAVAWAKRPWNSLGGMGRLKDALEVMCRVLEAQIDSLDGRWEIGGLIGRVAQIEGFEHFVNRLLVILGKLPEGSQSHRKTRTLYRVDFSTQIVSRLLETAEASNEIGFQGFLRWFAVFVGHRIEMPREPIQIPPLRFDSDHVRAVLERSTGTIREGAIRLLAFGARKELDYVTALLTSSKPDERPADRAWAGLIRSSVQDSESQPTIQFLERILSAKSVYPKAVEYAALEEYQQVTRASTVNDRERELGLPFQDS
jgi:hypothetical protein